MNCPTCGAGMEVSPCLNDPSKIIWKCPNNPEHWEVRDNPIKWVEFARLDPKDQVAVLMEHGMERLIGDEVFLDLILAFQMALVVDEAWREFSMPTGVN